MNKQKIQMIVACDLNGAIGFDNKLPWHLPKDLAHFKRTTLNHTVIMGRKTYESIGRPLPKRQNLVLSKSKTGSIYCNSLSEALSKATSDIFIIGGSEIYQQSLKSLKIDSIHLTRVHTKLEQADSFFHLPKSYHLVKKETAYDNDSHRLLQLDFCIYTSS